MTDSHHETIRQFCPSLAPIPTGVEPSLRPIKGTRAVMFDVYGTLLVSGSGDVGTAREAARSDAFFEALDAVGIPTQVARKGSVERLFETISRHHEVAQAEGIEFPEVDIVAVWRETFHGLSTEGDSEVDFERLALEYEVRVNPVWPMPGMESCLATLRDQGTILGIISNAQFYTRELFGALAGAELEALGFDRKLQLYSYECGQAKPGEFLYELAVDRLKEYDIRPDQVLYVGNDMLNDIMPAASVGFRTALFAGDQRSLRMREDDPRIQGIKPDIVITSLDQLSSCLDLE